MENQISSTNVSFDFLSQSTDFMNAVLNNITSCVLLADKEMRLQAFNDALKTIFSNKPDEHLLYKKCGDAIGCAYTVEEMKECGTTSQCRYCEIRKSAVFSYIEKKPIYNKKISREFFVSEKKKELKHLQFSTRHLEFEDEYYIVLIINDITQIVKQQEKLKKQKEQIAELLLRTK